MQLVYDTVPELGGKTSDRNRLKLAWKLMYNYEYNGKR